FDDVAQGLQRQRDLDPGERVWQGVATRAARRKRAVARRRVLSGLGAVAAVVALIVVYVGVLRGGPTVARGVLTVNDALVARQIPFAYAQDHDIWVSLRGALPQRLVHLSFTATKPRWTLVWSPDQSRLLATFYDTRGPTRGAWILSVPDGAATPAPSGF